MRALDRFVEYRRRALDLEARKARLASSDEAMRAVHRYVVEMDEEALERGWAEVAEVASGLSEEDAAMLAEHYLFCEDWHDVAASRRRGYDEAKKRCYRALLWLDGREGADDPRL